MDASMIEVRSAITSGIVCGGVGIALSSVERSKIPQRLKRLALLGVDRRLGREAAAGVEIPGADQLAQVAGPDRILRGEIAVFAGIGRDVVEMRPPAEAAGPGLDPFEAPEEHARAELPFVVEMAVDRPLGGRAARFEEIEPVEPWIRRQAERGEDRRHEIQMRGGRRDPPAGPLSGKLDDQRHVLHLAVERAPMAEPAVLAELLAVIRNQDHERAVEEPAPAELVEERSEAPVDRGHLGVVERRQEIEPVAAIPRERAIDLDDRGMAARPGGNVRSEPPAQIL